MNNDLISRSELRKRFQAILDRGDMFCEYDIIGMVDNAQPIDFEKLGESLRCQIRAEYGSCDDCELSCPRNELIKLLDSGRPQGEWILISERLPNICGVYNVTKRVIEGGRRYYIADSCYFDGTDTWHDDNRINFGRERVNCIIAWQPLPEAYKETDNDE